MNFPFRWPRLMPTVDPFQRLRQLLWIQAAALVLGGFLLTTFVTWSDRHAVEVEAQRNQGNLVRLVSEHAAWTMQAGQVLLDAVEREVARLPIPPNAAQAAELYERLKVIAPPGEQSHLWYVADPEGRLLTTTFVPLPQNVSVRDRDYHAFHRERRAPETHLGELVETRGTKAWSFTFSRGIYDARGELTSVVGVTLRLPYFQKLYQQLDLGPDSSVVLSRSDGSLLMRHPFNGAQMVTRLQRLPGLLKAAGDQPMTYTTKSPIDGRDRLVSLQRVQGYPMAALVTVTVDHLFDGWRERLKWRLIVLGLFGLSVVALSWALVRQTHALDKAHSQARTDRLTGLANRHAFEEVVQREWRHAQRHGWPLALLVVDVDHFKRYNDTLGHAAGDACLQRMAGQLRSSMRRANDLVARWGGEEFVCILPDCDADAAQRLAMGLVQGVRDAAMPHPGIGPAALVSVSIGLAVSTPAQPLDPKALLHAADKALYAAKQGGRDRVAVAGLSEAE